MNDFSRFPPFDISQVALTVAASAVTLSPGDVVEWRYTVSYGDVLPPELTE